MWGGFVSTNTHKNALFPYLPYRVSETLMYALCDKVKAAKELKVNQVVIGGTSAKGVVPSQGS